MERDVGFIPIFGVQFGFYLVGDVVCFRYGERGVNDDVRVDHEVVSHLSRLEVMHVAHSVNAFHDGVYLMLHLVRQ